MKRKSLVVAPETYLLMLEREPNSPVVHSTITYCIRPIGSDGLAAGIYGVFDGFVGTDVWQDGCFHIAPTGKPTLFTFEEVEDDTYLGRIFGDLSREVQKIAVHDDEDYVLTDHGLDLLREAGGHNGFSTANFSELTLRATSRLWPIRVRFFDRKDV